MKWTLSLILVCCAAFSQAQRFTNLNKNAFSISVAGVMTVTNPGRYWRYDHWPRGHQEYRIVKIQYYRNISKQFDLRAGFHRKSTSAYGRYCHKHGCFPVDNKFQFNLAQAGISWRWNELRLSPFVDLGFEIGGYRWQGLESETYFTDSLFYRTTYTQVGGKEFVFGPTLNFGLHYRVTDRVYASTSIGMRSLYSSSGDKMEFAGLISQSNALMLGMTF